METYSFVTVSLSNSLDEGELRRLLCDLWMIQVSPILADIPTESQTCMCQRLMSLGVIGLLCPEKIEEQSSLLSGREIAEIAQNKQLTMKEYEKIHQDALRRAREVLDES